MSDAPATPSPTKKATKAKKPKVAPAHPPVAAMVDDAITALKDRKGSSLAAIKKYISANNKNADAAKLAPFIKRYLKSAVVAGKLVQTKGTGAAGSFKMGKVEKPAKKVVKPKATKPKTPKKVKKPKAVKKSPKKATKSPKKAKKPAAKKVKTPKKPAKVAKVAKKPAKSPAKSPKKVKAAKPKTAKPKVKKAAKKA